jgi:hypothetical protein
MSAMVQRSLMSEFGLDGLNSEERRQLLHELVDSLQIGDGEIENLNLSEEVDVEIRNRVQEAKDHPERGMAWTTFKKQLLEEVDD